MTGRYPDRTNATPRRRGDVSGGDHPAFVESQLAMLAGSISPGRRHRQRVLEEANDSVGRLRGKKRTAQVIVALSVVLILVSPLIGALSRIDAPGPQRAADANAAALRHAEASRLSFDWALVEIFDQFRISKRPNR